MSIGFVKKLAFVLLLIRMFTVGAIIDRPQPSAKKVRPLVTPTKPGRDIVFSADLCYNGVSKKPPSEREVARRSRDGRSLRDFIFVLTSL